ncbi:MAG: hypothetical protein IKK70_04945 [Clostridia bacterium]|nr:hypothetical protein [Clostridia bacterium]
MEKLYGLIENLTSYPGVSGFEDMAFDGLCKYIETLGIFDETGTTSVGSFYGIVRCGKENAPLVLCDAHLDTVGFVVTEVCEGGFLRIAPIGGIAAKILPAAEINVYGKEIVKGVFASKPPHLQEAGESERKMTVESDISIDTGLPYERLKELVRVGTPAGFPCKLTKLLGDNLAGAGFDDRLCGAAVIRALQMVDKESLNVDVAFQFSGNEETGYKGAMTTAYRLNPDKAIVIDVTHAFVPGAPKIREGVRAGNGCNICFSPQTNRAFTKQAIAIAESENIPYQLAAAPGRTGTNSNAVQTTRNGIPTLLVSIPLKNMHTMSEIVNMNDALNTSRLIAAVLKSM